jgi:pyridoxine 5-phosphate synthase
MRATTDRAAERSASGAARQRLYVNVDHVATVRQARRGAEPDPVEAALLCERAGADGITAHLREDRRHIQDADVERLAAAVTTAFNFEIACTAEMLAIAERLRPRQVTLVPERREEVTTEGGLDLAVGGELLAAALLRLRHAGVRTSLFVDPDPAAVARARELGADAVELHTGQYAHRPDDPSTIGALRTASAEAARLGLAVHAGHGLTVANVGPVAAIAVVEELNIGHAIVSRALFIGLEQATREIHAAMRAARTAEGGGN